MPRKVKKTSARLAKEKKELQTSLVKKALEAGICTRREICKAAEMKPYELAHLFADDRDLYNEYTVRRRTLVDTAADNIQDIVDDPKHPNNFAASKYVLSHYKSDLDSILEAQDKDKDFAVTVGGETTASPVTIRFGSTQEE